MKKRRATAIAPVDNASAPEPSTLLLECGVEQSSRADISKDEHATSSSGKAAKRRKLFAAQQLEGGLRAIVTPQALPAHPFVADPHDHAETPFEAYQDIEPILFRLATLLGRTKAGATALRLYDPFYCAGSVKRHLGRLGFDSVRNDNVDFYNYSNRPTPGDFDVLISNPPFSGDHMPRTVTYAVECGRPWLLLMPDFVAKKTWFKQLIGSTPAAPGALPVQRQRLYYLGPATTPYTFAAPGRDGADGGGAPLVPRSHESSLPFQVRRPLLMALLMMMQTLPRSHSHPLRPFAPTAPPLPCRRRCRSLRASSRASGTCRWVRRPRRLFLGGDANMRE